MKINLIIIIFCFQIASCQNRTTKITPRNYLSNIKAPPELYSKDSIHLSTLIKNEIKEHKGGYTSSAYDSLTQILIDTIIYNPNYDKLAFFIIDKKENKKIYPKTLTESDIDYLIEEGHSNLPYNGYHYTGKAYIAIRQSNELKIKHFGITTAHYNYISNVRERQRQIYFEEYAAVNEEGYEYNFDDKRFWNNPNISKFKDIK